ncbi:MAG: O-methyltransferase [Thaumarchaeota archaeon]|nr:O-methyltransferase [Nitrososphaerota archaeon]
MSTEAVLHEIEEQAPRRGLPIIGAERGAFLDEVVRKFRPKRILEVGTLVGYSAIRMARLVGDDGRITCIEVDRYIAEVARANIERAGLSERVEIIIGDAKDEISKLRGRLDMVFLDASKDEYLTYLKGCERLLKPGGVVVADNAKVFASQMSAYLTYVRNSGGYSSSYKEAPSGADAVEISVRRESRRPTASRPGPRRKAGKA